MSSDWVAPIRHRGGKMPKALTGDEWIEPIYRGEPSDPSGVRRLYGFAKVFDWTHDRGPDDIVAYRVVQPC